MSALAELGQLPGLVFVELGMPECLCSQCSEKQRGRKR